MNGRVWRRHGFQDWREPVPNWMFDPISAEKALTSVKWLRRPSSLKASVGPRESGGEAAAKGVRAFLTLSVTEFCSFEVFSSGDLCVILSDLAIGRSVKVCQQFLGIQQPQRAVILFIALPEAKDNIYPGQSRWTFCRGGVRFATTTRSSDMDGGFAKPTTTGRNAFRCGADSGSRAVRPSPSY